MTRDHETLTRLLDYHDHITVPAVDVEDDLRRGRRRVVRDRTLLVLGAAATVVAIGVGMSWAAGRPAAERPLPVGQTRTPPAPSTPPPGFELVSLASLRPGPTQGPEPEPSFRWQDVVDPVPGEVDVVQLDVASFGGDSRYDWMLTLREDFPAMLPPGQVVEYGIVLDTDGDEAADCQIGVTTEVPKSATTGPYEPDQLFMSWITNLRTGRTETELAPYGALIDFKHPREALAGDPAPESRVMRFFFIGHETGPCAGYGASSNYYAWAASGRPRGPVEVDYAPDTRWLRMP